MGQQAEKDKIERVTGLGRRTGEETEQWNETTALRLHTEGRHQTTPTSLLGYTFCDLQFYSSRHDRSSVCVCVGRRGGG